MSEIPKEALEKAIDVLGWNRSTNSSTARDNVARYIADVSEKASLIRSQVNGISPEMLEALKSLILPNPEDDLLKEVSQAAQDHMEQHHAVCLTASSWDALARTMIAALRKGN